eukprot:6236162-Alexandrium_andersonii.AAC.1
MRRPRAWHWPFASLSSSPRRDTRWSLPATAGPCWPTPRAPDAYAEPSFAAGWTAHSRALPRGAGVSTGTLSRAASTRRPTVWRPPAALGGP